MGYWELILHFAVFNLYFGSKWLVSSSILLNLSANLVKLGFTSAFTSSCSYGNKIDYLMAVEEKMVEWSTKFVPLHNYFSEDSLHLV